MEVLFIRNLILFLNAEVERPIVINVDNIGAIYLTETAGTSTRTKHVDTRYHFVREYVEDSVVQIKFVTGGLPKIATPIIDNPDLTDTSNLTSNNHLLFFRID